MRQVTHALLTRPPLSHLSIRRNQGASFDLHVLGTPPAFILSQDQTLVKSVCIQFRIAWQFCSCLLFFRLTFKCLCSELFKRIFQGCCLLFNYQGSSLLLSQRQLIYIITSRICLSTTFFIFLILCCPQRSHEGGCPDDECYNITEIRNCQ